MSKEILKQQLKDFQYFAKDIEVIFIEGNSSDKTWEKIQLVKKNIVIKRRALLLKALSKKEKERQRLFFMDLKKLPKRFYLF